MKYIALLLFLTSCSTASYEKNKVLNFDYCNNQCVDAGKTMKTFEQGLGYVKCECECKKP